jgi:hypothetical protein
MISPLEITLRAMLIVLLLKLGIKGKGENEISE